MTKAKFNRICVSLDLETTGLSPEGDEIIEIGAIKFQNGTDIDTFHSLVNPQRPIPYRIKSLCNISQEEVDSAPSLTTLADDLIAFVGDCPIVGHNIGFDIAFLLQKGIRFSNLAYDTCELSRILLPNLSERTLSSVAAYFGIPNPSAHRALADAIVSREVFSALLARLCDLDQCALTELDRLAVKTRWWLADFLKEVGCGLTDSTLFTEAAINNSCVDVRSLDYPAPLQPRPVRIPLDSETLPRFFDDDGPIAGSFPNYERRPEQIELMQSVASALSSGNHLIAEAGTGIGKSIAYLLPASVFAFQNEIPVVISTNTINLQEQLVHEDFPKLAKAIEHAIDHPVSEMRVTQVKGRTNYLCLRRWEIVRNADKLPADTKQLLARIQVWLPSTDTGDCAEINLNNRDMKTWSRVCAQSYDCMGKRCTYQQRGLCFFHRARKKAEASHIIVTNHALFLSEIASGAQVLPEYSHIVIDEAHHLEDVATDQLGTQVKEQDISGYLDQIHSEIEGHTEGFLPLVENVIRSDSLDTEQQRRMEQLVTSLRLAVGRARARTSDFFNRIGELLQSFGYGLGEYDLQLRLTKAIQVQPIWSEVEIDCENLILVFEDIAKSLRKIHAIIDEQSDFPAKPTIDMEFFTLLGIGDELRRQMQSLVFDQSDKWVYWLTLGRRDSKIGLHSAPLHVGSFLRDSLYNQKESVILVGATLSADGSFDYLKERLWIGETRELSLGSPFDYSSAALIYVVSDMPEPGREGYYEAMIQALAPLCRATEGRCLVLFTSNSALRTTQSALQRALEDDDILVLGQGTDGYPKQLLNSLKRNPRTVILGTASFWEGVDVIGDALSLLVVVRLPFDVPTKPLFEARSETFDDPFSEFALRQTAFRLKQGFGRLIRSKADRGVMVVLDSRISNRSYGSILLNALPPCRVEYGTTQNLPDTVKEWLAGNEKGLTEII